MKFRVSKQAKSRYKGYYAIGPVVGNECLMAHSVGILSTVYAIYSWSGTQSLDVTGSALKSVLVAVSG